MSNEKFIDKKHKEHLSVLWAVLFSLIVMLIPLAWWRDIGPVFRLNGWLWAVVATFIPGWAFCVYMTIKFYYDPNKEYFRKLCYQIAILFLAIMGFMFAQYREGEYFEKEGYKKGQNQVNIGSSNGELEINQNVNK